MLRGAYGYGTCLSNLVSHPFSQTIPMARKKREDMYICMYMCILYIYILDILYTVYV